MAILGNLVAKNYKNYEKNNLGCGEDYKEGFINVDSSKLVKAEIVQDLNEIPYPFKDSEIDYIEANHILEHLNDPFTIMTELHRILKNDSNLIIGLSGAKLQELSVWDKLLDLKAIFCVRMPEVNLLNFVPKFL